MQQAMGGPMMGPPPGGPVGGPAGPPPRPRSPMKVLLVPVAIIMAGVIGSVLFSVIAAVADVPAIALIGSLCYLGSLVGVVLALIWIWGMLSDLKRFTGDQTFAPWWLIVPCLQYYFMWLVVPKQVGMAKQIARCGNPLPRSIVVYFLLFPYALAADIADIVTATGGGPPPAMGGIPGMPGMGGPPGAPGPAPGGYPPPGGGFGAPPGAPPGAPGGYPPQGGGGYGAPPQGGGFGGPPPGYGR